MFPLSRFHGFSCEDDYPLPTPANVTVTDKDNESFAYFLSDPTCKSFQLTL